MLARLMLRRWWIGLFALALVAGACGDDSESTDPVDDGDAENEEAATDLPEGGDDEAPDEEAATDPPDGDDADNNATGDPDDLGDITGTDVDPDDLGEAGDLADEVDDLVSLGDCVIETLGLSAVAPDGLQCRLLDTPIPGFDGFTMFADGDVFTITFASRTPIRPCEVPGFCENPTPIDIPGFSDAVAYDTLGLGNIFGGSDDYEVDLVVSRTSGPLSDEDLAAVRAAAESLGPV